MSLLFFLSNTFEFGIGHEANGDLIKSNDFLYLNNKTTFRDTSYLESSIFYRTKTKDFWITRGNPTYWYVNKPKNYGGALQYKGASQDYLNFSLMYNYAEEDDWLNWIQGNFFGIYQKKQKTTVASINWFGGDKHELRLKAQMVGFTARDPKPYLSDID